MQLLHFAMCIGKNGAWPVCDTPSNAYPFCTKRAKAASHPPFYFPICFQHSRFSIDDVDTFIDWAATQKSISNNIYRYASIDARLRMRKVNGKIWIGRGVWRVDWSITPSINAIWYTYRRLLWTANTLFYLHLSNEYVNFRPIFLSPM